MRYPRKERAHLDPPGIVRNPEGHLCYAVTCGFYQLHGAEGKKKGLRGEISNTVSLKASITAVDFRDTIWEAGERDRTVKTEPQHRLDEPDLSETSASEDGDKTDKGKGIGPTAYIETLHYAHNADKLLASALQLIRDMASDRPKTSGEPSGYAKRYNDLKGEWKAIVVDTDDEIMKQIRSG